MGNQLSACAGKSKTLHNKETLQSCPECTKREYGSKATESKQPAQSEEQLNTSNEVVSGGDIEVEVADVEQQATQTLDTPESKEGRTAENDGNKQTGDFEEKANALRKVVQRRIAKIDLTNSLPETVVKLLIDNPNLKLFISLKKKLLICSDEWFHSFIDVEGITRLLDAVAVLTTSRVTNVTDAMLLLAAMECIRCVMNNTQGLEFFITDIDATHQLIKGMDTSNCMVKRQVIQLLTAVCIYSEEGYQCCLQALHFHKVKHHARYRFSMIMSELKKSIFSKYSTALVSFITCLIDGHDDMPKEHDTLILNEFLGLNLLETVHGLMDSEDSELVSQTNQLLSLIEELQESSMSSTHADMFNDIYRNVCESPHSENFLAVLHFLADISTDNQLCNEKWEALSDYILKLSTCDKPEKIKRLESVLAGSEQVKKTEKVTCDAGTMTCVLEQSEAPTRSPALDKTPDLPATSDQEVQTEDMGTFSNGNADTEVNVSQPHPPVNEGSSPPPPPPLPGVAGPPPPPLPGMAGPPPPPPLPGMAGPPPPPLPGLGGPPPPPPLPGLGGPPPPPPLPGMGGPPPSPLPGLGGPPPPPPPPGMGGPPPPPPPPGMNTAPIAPLVAPTYQMAAQTSIIVVPTPTPSKKMKIYNWTKIQDRTLRTSAGNVWEKVSALSDRIHPDFHAVEEMFSQKTVSHANDMSDSAPMKKKSEVISLLDSKRSMNINIFLKQFKRAHSEIASLIRAGDTEQLGQEKLVLLQKIMPQPDEVEALEKFEGDETKLGNAEQFFKELIKIGDYKLRINIMILKIDFVSTAAEMRETLNDYKSAIETTISSISLEQFLRLVLRIGNFMNKGRYAGNAAGFRLCSLSKLTDTKSNRSRVTLLHYIVEEVYKQDEAMLTFVEKLQPLLLSISRKSLDNLESELNVTKGTVSTISKAIKKSKEDLIKEKYKDFIADVTNQLKDIYHQLDEVKSQSKKLAKFFCEDVKTFSVDEFLLELLTFLEKCEQAHTDNVRRKELEEKNAKRKKEREEASKKKTAKGQSKRESEEEVDLVEMLLGEIRNGKTLRRTRRTERAN